jgi:hypothetical protein
MPLRSLLPQSRASRDTLGPHRHASNRPWAGHVVGHAIDGSPAHHGMQQALRGSISEQYDSCGTGLNRLYAASLHA